MASQERTEARGNHAESETKMLMQDDVSLHYWDQREARWTLALILLSALLMMSQQRVRTVDQLPLTPHQQAQLHHFIQILGAGDTFLCGDADPIRRPRVKDLQSQLTLAYDLRQKMQQSLADVREKPSAHQQERARHHIEDLKEDMLRLVALSEAFDANYCLPDYNHYILSYREHSDQIRRAMETVDAMDKNGENGDEA